MVGGLYEQWKTPSWEGNNHDIIMTLYNTNKSPVKNVFFVHHKPD